MSLLNKLKELRSEYPNDQDFGERVNLLIKLTKTCCDDIENIIDFVDNGDLNPYGFTAGGKKCKACGKIISVRVNK